MSLLPMQWYYAATTLPAEATGGCIVAWPDTTYVALAVSFLLAMLCQAQQLYQQKHCTYAVGSHLVMHEIGWPQYSGIIK